MSQKNWQGISQNSTAIKKIKNGKTNSNRINRYMTKRNK